MTQHHDYAAALEWANHEFRGRTVHDGHPILAIFHALKVADRLMQEQSAEVYEAGGNAMNGDLELTGELRLSIHGWAAYHCFLAMRDQLLAEVGE